MKFQEIYNSAEAGETFERPGLDRDEPVMFNIYGDLVYANSRCLLKLSLADYRADDWRWVKQLPRCEKCGQRLPEGWTAPKQGLSSVEIAEQWKGGDEFTNPGRPAADCSLTFNTHYQVCEATSSRKLKTLTRTDLIRTDWYFTNKCSVCGQRIGGERK